MTIEEARIKLSRWTNREDKPEKDPDKVILGYFIAPINAGKFYDFLRSFWDLETPAMVELFKSNGDLQKSIEQEDVDVFYFRGLYWRKIRQWNEENDKESYTIFDIPQELCVDDKLE